MIFFTHCMVGSAQSCLSPTVFKLKQRQKINDTDNLYIYFLNISVSILDIYWSAYFELWSHLQHAFHCTPFVCVFEARHSFGWKTYLEELKAAFFRTEGT